MGLSLKVLGIYLMVFAAIFETAGDYWLYCWARQQGSTWTLVYGIALYCGAGVTWAGVLHYQTMGAAIIMFSAITILAVIVLAMLLGETLSARQWVACGLAIGAIILGDE